MAKPFRKLEIEFNGARYVLGQTGSEMLLAWMDTFDLPDNQSLQTLREDLRASLATAIDEPAPENPFADECDEPAQVSPAPVLKGVAKENAEACGDCRVPRCRFCDLPGRRVPGVKHADGRVLEHYYLCDTPSCIMAKAKTPMPAKLFTGGAE